MCDWILVNGLLVMDGMGTRKIGDAVWGLEIRVVCRPGMSRMTNPVGRGFEASSCQRFFGRYAPSHRDDVLREKDTAKDWLMTFRFRSGTR